MKLNSNCGSDAPRGADVRTLAAVLVLGLAALVCGFLFLAGFEYPGITTWKVVTGSLAALFLAGAFYVGARGRPK